ncbi:hypothetical protein AX16_009480 [Volvariella volvacea WC 439]|nr:hypothetical protein AX16_009480 [Volvariella volvacea WC 439]
MSFTTAGGISRLISLPPEVLSQVGLYLDVKNVSSLRLVCTYVSQVFTPYLTDSANYHLSDSLRHQSHSLRRRHGSPFVPTPDSLVRYIRDSYITLDPYEIDHHHHDAGYQREMETLLREIARFRALKFVTIVWNSRVHATITPKHMDCLGEYEKNLLSAVAEATGGEMVTLHIESPYTQIPSRTLSTSVPSSPLGSFTRLKQVHLVHVSTAGALFLLAPLFAQLPALEKIWVQLNHESRLAIQELFPPDASTASPVPSSLKSLVLHGDIIWSLNSAIQDLPAFPNLRSLHLTGLSAGTSEAQLDGFWKLLKDRRVRLDTLYTDCEVTAPLVDFLASFSGLRVLRVQDSHVGSDAHAIAERFISRALPLHAPTLRTLMVPVACIHLDSDSDRDSSTNLNAYGTPWPSPARFSSLKTLSASSPRGAIFSLETCQRLLNWLERFPMLDMVRVNWLHEVAWTTDTRAIARQLVGRTGRPGNWTIYGLSKTISWGIRSQKEGGWYYV